MKKRETSQHSQTLIMVSILEKLGTWDHHLPSVASDMKPRVLKSLTLPLREKKSNIDTPEVDMRKYLTETELMSKKNMEQTEEEDSLYCRSLIPILKKLSTKKKSLVKIKICQLLFDLQYDNDAAKMT